MTRRFRPQLVNEAFGDPALYVDLAFEHRALLFDMGDLAPLGTRKLLRLSHVFVTHAHMDHFIGFDRLLRAFLHQDKTIHLYGPAGFVEQVQHRLSAYTWNLLPEYATDLILVATELGGDGGGRTATFRSHTAFSRERDNTVELPAAGVLLHEETFRVRAMVLDHKIPCLAYALEERAHVNIRRDVLEEMGLPIGPWLVDLKREVAQGAPDDLPVRIWWREGNVARDCHLPLGALRNRVASITPGQKIAYVVDVAYHPTNARAIVDLVHGADLLFIEAAFLEADASTAAERGHLTARQAGRLAYEAAAKQIVPIHFSPRYVGREAELRREAQEAFGAGGAPADERPGRSVDPGVVEHGDSRVQPDAVPTNDG
jgi:ribonuclease Z